MSHFVPPRALLLSLFVLLSPCGAAFAQTREDARLVRATQVLEELRATPDQNIPTWLMDRAYGVAVIPDVIKGAVIFWGGRHGNGVLVSRDAAGRFSNPAFVSLTGGSLGRQTGAQASDVIDLRHPPESRKLRPRPVYARRRRLSGGGPGGPER